jgi:hypothetical protein
MSLATPSSSALQASAPSFNPFGPNATLGSDDIRDNPEPVILHAPHARAAVSISSLQGNGSRPGSRPDFIRGFGLDIPEEDEEAMGVEAEIEAVASKDVHAVDAGLGAAADEADLEVDMDIDRDQDAEVSTEPDTTDDFTSSSLGRRLQNDATFGVGSQSFLSFGLGANSPIAGGFGFGQGALEQIEEAEEDGLSTAAQSRMHSRHASKLSAALSLRSVGGPVRGSPIEASLAAASERARQYGREHRELRETQGVVEEEDAIEDWTGSEDIVAEDDLSDDEVCCLLLGFAADLGLMEWDRVLASGRILRMRSVRARSGSTVVWPAERRTRPGGCRSSRGHPRMHPALGRSTARTISSPTRATRSSSTPRAATRARSSARLRKDGARTEVR